MKKIIASVLVVVFAVTCLAIGGVVTGVAINAESKESAGSVTLTAPANPVSGTISITASHTPVWGQASIQVFLIGPGTSWQPTSIGYVFGTTVTIPFDTTTLPNGTYYLSASAVYLDPQDIHPKCATPAFRSLVIQN
jgi:hypothetical protein